MLPAFLDPATVAALVCGCGGNPRPLHVLHMTLPQRKSAGQYWQGHVAGSGGIVSMRLHMHHECKRLAVVTTVHRQALIVPDDVGVQMF